MSHFIYFATMQHIKLLDSSFSFFNIFRNWPTFPQVYMNGEFLGGSDILLQMHQNGKQCLLVLIFTSHGKSSFHLIIMKWLWLVCLRLHSRGHNATRTRASHSLSLVNSHSHEFL